MVTAFEKDAAMKKFTEEDAQRFGKMLSNQLLEAIKIWEDAMKVFPIGSREYKDICNAGSKTQDAYHRMKNHVFHQLGSEVAEKHFAVKEACGFS